MSSCAELADYDWLTGLAAAAVLRDLAREVEPLHTLATRLRCSFPAARVHLLLEQAELRQRATAKFSRAHDMFFTRRGLEQATDQWVAAYKARRFVGRSPVADLCCGIGGDLLALAKAAPTVGIDRDPVAACLAAANARVIRCDVTLQVDEVAQFDACVFASWHIDPDRRRNGGRTSSLAWSSPEPSVIDRLLGASPNAAVKLAPAADVPAAWESACELEWISRDRQCRQLVAWHGELAEFPAQRRATVLSADGVATRSVISQAEVTMPTADSLDRFLFEPDAAVLAAHLTGALAAEHGLAAISSGIAYLTGPAAIDDPALGCFEVHDVLPFQPRLIAQHLRQRGIGRLEIKKRGVEHDPETVRKQLNLSGDESATLILTKLNRKRVAILVRRVRPGCSPASLNLEPRTLNPPHAACL